MILLKNKKEDKGDTTSTEMSPAEALNWYDKQLKEYPYDTGLLSGKATFLENMGRDEEALRCYMLAVETNPYNTICWYRMGILLEDKEDFDAALESYNEAVKIDPRFVECWLRIGNLFCIQNFNENAKECYNWILEIDPEHNAAKKALAHIEEKKLDSPANHTPQGLRHKEGNRTKMRKKRKKRKKKMSKTIEPKPSIEGTTSEVQKKLVPILENLNPRTQPKNPKENKEDISIEQIVDNLEELHDLLVDRTEAESATSTDGLSGIGVDDQNDEDTSFDYEYFTEQLYELRDTLIQHTEKLTGVTLEDALTEVVQTNIPLDENPKDSADSPIPPSEELEYPTYDDLNAQLDELTGLLSQTIEASDSPSGDSLEAGLDTLQKIFDQSPDVSSPLPKEDMEVISNKVSINPVPTEDQTPLEIKEFEKALNRYNQSQEPTPKSLDAWDPNSELMPNIYEEEISLDDLITEGRKHMKNKDYDQALACFDRVLEYDPQCLDAWSAKGDLMLQMSREEVSLEKLVIKGRMHLEKREYDKALGCFDRALELDPQCLDAWSAKGIVLIEMEKGKKKRKMIS
jgi:tetratricopeptide (TPR) repeat protein